SGAVWGLSAARTSGLIPLPASEVPSAAWWPPPRRARAPPGARGGASLKGPLPEQGAATTVSTWGAGSAQGGISAGDAAVAVASRGGGGQRWGGWGGVFGAP